MQTGGRSRRPAPDNSDPPQQHPAEAALIKPGRSRLVLRHRQSVALAMAHNAIQGLTVESGCLLASVTWPGGRRQLVLVLHPHETVPTALADIVPGTVLTAAVPTTLVRAGTESAAAGEAMLVRVLQQLAVIGRGTGEERLATLIAELGRRFCGAEATAWAFDCPLTRADMADWLAVNPDTLSRLMSRLRACGIVATPSRQRIIVPDTARLEELLHRG